MVSIVTPVYNCAPYIEACLDSLRAQTMQDFEVILVDDHGTDDSIAIARQWAERHGEGGRFRIIETPVNSGPGIARNVGMEAACGNYVAFIDSDDCWQPTFLEALVQAASPIDADLAYCQLQYRGGSRDGQIHRNPVIPAGDFTPQLKRHFMRHFVTFSVCFLFRRQFLVDNGLCFPDGRNSEDTHFLTHCLLLAHTIACVDEPLYVYCVRQQSLTTGRDPHRWKARLTALNGLYVLYRQLCRDPRYTDLQLGQYAATMRILWLKKGLAQALRELLK